MPPKSGKSGKSNKKDKKKERKEYHKNTSAVFRIKPNSTSTAVIKYQGIVTTDQKLGDEIVELDSPMHPEWEIYGRHSIKVKNVDEYEVLSRIYRSNIVGSYIVLEDNYPVMYLTIEYMRSLVTGSLFQIYVSLKMDHEQKLSINTQKKYEMYRNLTFTGKWNLTIECDKELKELWREKITPILREESINNFHKDFSENLEKQNMTDEDVMKWVSVDVESKMKWYESIMSESDFDYKSILKTRNYLIELSQDQRLHNLIRVAMECRIINRRNESGIDDDYNTFVIPEKIISMNDLRQKIIDDDELIVSDSE